MNLSCGTAAIVTVFVTQKKNLFQASRNRECNVAYSSYNKSYLIVLTRHHSLKSPKEGMCCRPRWLGGGCLVFMYMQGFTAHSISNNPFPTGGLWPSVSHLHSGLLHLSGITYGGCGHLGIFPVSWCCCWNFSINLSNHSHSREGDLDPGSEIKVRVTAEEMETSSLWYGVYCRTFYGAMSHPCLIMSVNFCKGNTNVKHGACCNESVTACKWILRHAIR